MSSIATIGAVGAIGSALINKSAAKKNQAQAVDLQYTPIDLDKLQSDAHDQAVKNATNSIALEKSLEPSLDSARFGLQDQVNADLQSGGNLPTDVANQVTRASITGADSAGLQGAAGPITAASLGLTSLQLRNANQAKAASLLAANPLPTAGLDPGQIASASIANNNQLNNFNLAKSGVLANANQSNANANSGLLGSLGSLAPLVTKLGAGSGGSSSGGGLSDFGSGGFAGG